MDAQLDLQVRYRQDFVPNKNCINLSSVIHHYKQVAHGTLFTGPLSYFARIYSSMQLCNFAVFIPQLIMHSYYYLNVSGSVTILINC